MASIHLPAFADFIAGRDPAKREPERQVLAAMQERRPVAHKVSDAATFRYRLADRVAVVRRQSPPNGER